MPRSKHSAAASPSRSKATSARSQSFPRQRKAELTPFHLLRGRVDGKEGSWVRLTEFEGRIEGAIWDGEELYAVTSYAEIADAMTKPLAANDSQTVIYRTGRYGRSATGKFLRPSHPRRAAQAHAARPIQIAGAGDARAGDRRRGARRPDRNLADRRRRLTTSALAVAPR
jgi:hypothetical protein